MKIEILFDGDKILNLKNIIPSSLIHFKIPIQKVFSSDLIIYLSDNPIKNDSGILKNRKEFLENINNFYATINANTKEQLAKRS